MIQHIVLIKWKPDTTQEDIVEAFEAARAPLDEIDSVKRLTLGRNRGESDHGFTHALIVNLADNAGLRGYLDHPTRMRYVRERLQPLEEQRIEIDVPVDMTLRRDPTVRDWSWARRPGWGLHWMSERRQAQLSGWSGRTLRPNVTLVISAIAT